ncbi:MAG: hypothetical protein MUF36_07150 [Bacteroidales bacterium]|jgi:hypothetical protein|nr:hypothetical protein [Bacteroidales bacterium]
MKPSELKKFIIGSLDENTDPQLSAKRLVEEGVLFDFSKGFSDKVLNKIMSGTDAVTREIEFTRSMRFAFNRVALTGVAAIVLLLLSIFLAEGSLSFNSFLGIGDTYDEGIISMLTGK